MKIEMGESLIQSWLKHEYKCQITQMNWKVSPRWDVSVRSKEIKPIYDRLKNVFKNLDNVFVSKKMSLSQLIQQGEVDCLGVRFKQDDPFVVEKFFVVDVAFHEGGLNYNGIKETTARVIKKNIRTALTVYQSFGVKHNVEIVFATPYALSGHVEILKNATSEVENAFRKEGFNYSFKFICNETFHDEIYQNVKLASQEFADSTELFVRGIKMASLMERFQTVAEIKESPSVNFSEGIRIGATVQASFTKLSDTGLSSDDIKSLCDASFSKSVFGLYLPVLIEKTDEDDCGFVNGYRRYYPTSYIFAGKEYLLCNDWYERNRDGFEKWYAKF